MSDTPVDNAYWRVPPPGRSPQEIWALLEKNTEAHEQAMRELREMRLQQRLQQQETDRLIKENAREMKETTRRFGELGNRFGELAEHLVAPNIIEKFNSLGFAFEKVALNQRLIDPSGKSYAEIDIILENDNMVMAVEVKSKPRKEDIDVHISRIEALRQKADPRVNKRFLGAVAAAIMLDETRDYIYENGLYAIEQSGDTVKISNGEGFTPREW